MADLSWQEALASETDASKKEWMALERRYNLQLSCEDPATQDKHVRLFLSLSDPELPTRLTGQVELEVTLPGNYPVEAAYVDFTQWNSRLSDEQVEALNVAVNARAQQLCGGFALRNLLTWIDNNFWRVIAPFEKGLEAEKEAEEVSRAQGEEDLAGEVPVVADKKSKRRRGQRPCRFFVRGNCRDGEKCKFSHAKKEVVSERDGSDAPGADSVSAVREADPTRPPVVAAQPKKKKTRTRKCKFFAQSKCRDGDKCKFSHELKNTGTNSNGAKQRSDALPRAVVVQLGSPTKAPVIDAEVKITSAPSNSEICISQAEDSSEWSEVQQRALDLALKKYPASMDIKERWTNIASEVEGRSLNECIDRFKMLCELMRRGVDPTAAVNEEKDEEEPVETNRSEHDARNSKITPLEKRVTIQTEPEVKGTQICLDDLFLHEVGTLVAHRLVCQVQCENCPLKFDAILSLDSSEIQKWCPRCSVLHHVVMRPVFAHSQSNILAYVDTENCSIVDVLPTDMLATCLECGCEALLERITPRQRAEQSCFSCHVKLAVMAKRFVAGQLEGASTKRSHSPNGTASKVAKSSKKGAKQIVETFVLGQPLPRNGACDHYKHSLRWFRFQCCGKAFPCDVCHDSSDCPEANLGKFASRMICGLCSKEQSSSTKLCPCGNDVASKRSTSQHWEGGAGCRDSLQMSRWDKQKYRGLNKTESKKFKRVGAEAKKRRENANAQQ
ncbi:CHY zinc finger [Phytophthora infestans]|uniref:CHY zinc finger n=1 Tax=Phytophthora infestans TaxID=4787 RepID=A0A8S9UF60_PHYIN|nr:CHY zinc finger [Phytophthora infestans]